MEAEVSDNQNDVKEEPVSEEVQHDSEALLKQIEALQSKLERVEGESKKHASKYRNLRDSVENSQKEKLEQEEAWEERFKLERKTNEELRENMKSIKEGSLYQNLNFEVAKYAPDARKVERVVSAILDGNALTVSEDGLKFEGVKEAIDHLRNEEEYLFKHDKPVGMVNKNPSGKAPKAKTLTEMNKSERDAAFKENIKQMLKAQTRR